MPRRHLRTYRRPKSAADALAEIERALDEPDNAAIDVAHPRERAPVITARSWRWSRS